MPAISHGMNVDQVRTLGNKLQSHYASNIDQFITEIDNQVNDTTNSWVGKDGNDFRSWWPAKRSALKAIRDDLHGFGQSALNNASEQEAVSG